VFPVRCELNFYIGFRRISKLRSGWELAAETYLLKLQLMQTRFCAPSEITPVRDLHTAFNLPYVYDYIIKLCRQKAEVMQKL
jgi:hypothetical protein